MDPEHRKIELQSPADLTFLTSKLRTAARQKLDLHLPPVKDTSEPDELRRQVEDLVDSFVAEILHGMRNNISINGIDVVQRGREGLEVDDAGKGVRADGIIGGEDVGVNEVENVEYEPFDDKLRSQLSSTVARRDKLIAKISQHRRNTPATAAAAFQAQFERENEALLEGQRGEQNADLEIADSEALKRQDEVQRSWERALEGLGRLNKGLPETRARLERAGEVAVYLGEGQRKK